MTIGFFAGAAAERRSEGAFDAGGVHHGEQPLPEGRLQQLLRGRHHADPGGHHRLQVLRQ